MLVTGNKRIHFESIARRERERNKQSFTEQFDNAKMNNWSGFKIGTAQLIVRIAVVRFYCLLDRYFVFLSNPFCF